MRHLLVALALAGAFSPLAGMANEPLTRIAQLSRDVTDAVRKQRNERRERSPTKERVRSESER